ncbi:MAG: hypothetical protein ACLU4J_08400 [Butyricimonas paravirosa]
MDFMKNHVFAFLIPELTDRILPIYIYLAYHMYLDSPLGASPSTTKYDGMDFWAFCLKEMCKDYFIPALFVHNSGRVWKEEELF